MAINFVPYCHATSIFDVDITFLKKINIKTILADLDNTLDSYKAMNPSLRVFDLKRKLEEVGIELIVISNNKEKRVKPYASALSVRYLYSTHKPLSKRLIKFLDSNNIDKNSVLFVGDQLLTDVVMCNNARIKVMLTEKIVKEDQWTTHFNRLIDCPIRHLLRKKNKLVDWKEKM
ncbi:MAG: YqeG family HAD IIIA-type phosphatase [Erysipelotrichales bacterium]|nr:YqeG family HAD IIIA-type phosphatase [Erysipelotrichales bacterium]